MDNYYEQQIDLCDLCIRLLKKWKQIMIVSIICALLGNAFAVFQNKNNYEKYDELREKYSLNEYYYNDSVLKELFNIEKDKNINTISSIQNIKNAYSKYLVLLKQKEDAYDYLNNSLLLQLDKDNAVTLVKQYDLSIGGFNDLSEIQAIYSDITTNLSTKMMVEDVLKAINKETGINIESKYLQEVINIENFAGGGLLV